MEIDNIDVLKIDIIKNPGEIAKTILKSSNKEKLINLLWDLHDNSNDKKIKKSCKKVFYILKSKGVDVDNTAFRKKEPEKANETEYKTKVSENKIEYYRAFLYLPDFYSNSRILTTFYNISHANYILYDIIYNLEDGIKQFGEQRVSKKAIERISEAEKEIIEIPVEYALSRVKKYIGKNEASIKKIPETLLNYINNVGFEVHPVLKLYTPAISGLITPEEEKSLFGRPEIVRLTIPDNFLKGFKEEINQANNSILIINNMTPKERIEHTVNRFINYYFTEERIMMYRDILLDIALYFHKNGEYSQAKQLVNYAEELVRSGYNISSHPLVRLLIYKSFFTD